MKATGTMESCTGKGDFYILMVHPTMVSISMVERKGMVRLSFLMEIITKDTS